MKIVIVDTTVHKGPIGGGHLYLPAFIRGLVDKGHEVHLVVKEEPDEMINGFLNASGAIIHKKPWKRNGLIQDTTPLFAAWVNKLQPDVYLISASYDIGWTVLPLLDSQIATAAIGHNDSETFYLPVRHYHSFLTRVVGVSPEMCEHYISDCSVSPERVDWIPYGVTISETSPVTGQSGKLEIAYVGRVVEEQKRISDVIAVAKILSSKNIDYRLTIVGDGPDMPKVQAQLQKEIEEGKVVLTGWLSRSKVLDVLRSSEVFLLTSSYEGFCIALVESIANGCCPVVTDIRSGNKKLVQDGVNGFVIEVGDTGKFAARIIELAGDRQKLSNLRLQAWSNRDLYSTSRMVENYEAFFARAISEAKGSPRVADSSFPLMSICLSKYPVWARRLKLLLVGEK